MPLLTGQFEFYTDKERLVLSSGKHGFPCILFDDQMHVKRRQRLNFLFSVLTKLGRKSWSSLAGNALLTVRKEELES